RGKRRRWRAPLAGLGGRPRGTVTSTDPAAWAGVVAVIVVALTTFTAVAAVPPPLTVAPAAKFDPPIVIGVPPSVEPELGLTMVTLGEVGTVGSSRCRPNHTNRLSTAAP